MRMAGLSRVRVTPLAEGRFGVLIPQPGAIATVDVSGF